MRTMFVNPGYFENPKRRRGGRKGKRRGSSRRGRRSGYRRGQRRSRGKRRSRGRRYGRAKGFRAYGRMQFRRNAGITPFVQPNPLILSNPRRRRTRRRNPAFLPSGKTALSNFFSMAGGAGAALATNAVALNRIENAWWRRGAQAVAAVLGGYLISTKSQSLGGAYGGAMMYPLLQDLAGDLLGIGVIAGVTAKDADIESLAADLQDVIDDMDGSGLSEDYEEYAW